MLIAIAAALAVTLLLPATSLADPCCFFNTADGSRVVFESSQRLVPKDTDNKVDVYKRVGGITSLVSQGEVHGNGPINATLDRTSSDASAVFFHTSEKLVPGDTDNSVDLYKRSGGTTVRVSTSQMNGNGAFDAALEGASDDGSKAFFSTAEQLVGADSDSSVDIYERSGGATRLVSKGQINGNGAFDALLSFSPDNCPDVVGNPGCGAITRDGSKVFFSTREQLVSEDTDSSLDVYERFGGTTTLVSKGQINGNGANPAFFDGISTDGSKVFFSTDEQLVGADSDARVDVYERSGGVTSQISKGQINGNGALDATFDGVTGNGSVVWFNTNEQLVGADTDTDPDVYQRSGGTTTLISREDNSAAHQKGIPDIAGAFFATANSDGSRVFFSSEDPFVSADTNDHLFDGYERFQGQTTWVTRGPIPFNGSSRGAFIDGIANDGRTVYFDTDEPLVASDDDNSYDIYQRSGGKTTMVSQGQINGNGVFDAAYLGSSSDGSKIFFRTSEKLVPGDRDNVDDIYERSGGTTKLISG